MPVEIASPTTAEYGAAPTWDGREGTLLWVDTPACQVHRYDPATGRDGVLDTLPQPVGAAMPRSLGGLVCNLTDGVALLDPDGTRRWLTYWSREGARCAGAAVDPMGRLWAGSAGSATTGPAGWLAVIEPDGATRVAVPDLSCPTGIAWSPDETTMYLVDGPAGRLDAFDYDAATGTVTGRRPVAPLTGVPGSACPDADGCLWVALDGAVHRYTADGRLDRVIDLSTPRATGCAFGGPRLTDLYVTTAAGQHGPALLVIPDAGAGLPATTFAG